MKSRLLLAALLGAACNVSSCGGGDDSNPIDPGPVTPPVRNRPDSLLTSWFERAYETQNRDLYEEMLDAAFTFKFLPADVDSFGVVLGLDASGSWSTSKDLQSTTNMFDDATVSAVALDLAVGQNLEYQGDDCDGCRQLEVGVELHVTTNPPGDEPLVFDVVEAQTFIVKPDPADTTLWVIYRQVDQEPVLKTFADDGDGEREISSNTPVTWGVLKAMFF